MFKQIVGAVDPAQDSQRVLALLVDLAQHYEAKILLLSVASAETAPYEAFLAQAQAFLQQQGVANLQSLVKQGNVPFVICDVADECNADLIVVGSRGLTDDQDADSVSRRVIALSPCPVLVVP